TLLILSDEALHELVNFESDRVSGLKCPAQIRVQGLNRPVTDSVGHFEKRVLGWVESARLYIDVDVVVGIVLELSVDAHRKPPSERKVSMTLRRMRRNSIRAIIL